jgi:photosystem II stability/assembly factor-like uncharacterized protein
LDTATTVTTGTDSSYWQIVSNANALAFSDIWFTDTLHGFAAGSNGYIYLSADGGTTWTQSAQLEPSSSGQLGIQTLFFSGSQIGYAVGLMHIAVTANGGQSWTIKSRPDLPITGAQRWPSLQFITPTTGFFSAGQKLWRTDDSADHWTPIEIDSVGSFYFFGTNNGVSFAYPNRINRTLDGATWQNTAILPNSSSGMPFTYMQFSNDQTGWFTDLNRISTTSNGGVSWKAVFQPYPDIITDFQVLSGQTVYLAGVNHLYKTMDGGTTWQREYTLSSNLASQGGLIAIFFLDDHHGWATGGNGVVLRYRH